VSRNLFRLVTDRQNVAQPIQDKLVSFTPGFSPVIVERRRYKTVSNGFPAFAVETVKTVEEK